MDNLTDEQLESAARHYCEMVGVNPDEMVELRPEVGDSSIKSGSRWRFIAREVLKHWLIDESIRKSRQSPGTTELGEG